jgi:two-component system cell cycle response regulator DivK
MVRTILLIEDNEQNRYLVSFLLEKNGFRVLSAMDGISGIELAKTPNLSMILLDIQLPRLDGYQVARALRSDARLDGVPIVAVTSYAMQGDREMALAAGCDGYFEKPIDPDTFVSDIKKFLPRGTNDTGTGGR